MPNQPATNLACIKSDNTDFWEKPVQGIPFAAWFYIYFYPSLFKVETTDHNKGSHGVNVPWAIIHIYFIRVALTSDILDCMV